MVHGIKLGVAQTRAPSTASSGSAGSSGTARSIYSFDFRVSSRAPSLDSCASVSLQDGKALLKKLSVKTQKLTHFSKHFNVEHNYYSSILKSHYEEVIKAVSIQLAPANDFFNREKEFDSTSELSTDQDEKDCKQEGSDCLRQLSIHISDWIENAEEYARAEEHPGVLSGAGSSPIFMECARGLKGLRNKLESLGIYGKVYF